MPVNPSAAAQNIAEYLKKEVKKVYHILWAQSQLKICLNFPLNKTIIFCTQKYILYKRQRVYVSKVIDK